jgi:capsid assembly protease
VSLTQARVNLPKGPLALHPRFWGGKAFFDFAFERPEPKPLKYEICGDYAVIEIKGTLVQTGAGYDEIAYDCLGRCFLEALSSEAAEIVLKINSPGGDFQGCLERVFDMRKAAKAAGKRVVAFTDSRALSAGYALACVADQIVMTPSAAVGSIGVWMAMVDVTAFDKAMGQNIVIVASGERKADRNPHVPITDKAVEGVQSEVDLMAGLFFKAVSEARGVSAEALVAIEGASVYGTQAVTYKLCDKIVASWAEFLVNDDDANPDGGGQMSWKDDVRKAAASGDAEAKALVKAWDEPEKKDKKEAKGKSEGEDEKDEKDEKEAKAEDGDDDEDDKTEGKKAKKKMKGAEPSEENEKKGASALEARLARLEAAETTRATQAEASERETLLASRADLDDDTRSLFAALPIATLREKVKSYPRRKGFNPAAASQAMPTVQGEGQGDLNMPLDPTAQALLDQKMNGKRPVAKFEVGCADPAAARAFLDAQAKANAANGGN